MNGLWQVAAQGHFQTRLGRTCFSFEEAVAMSADLRSRGYADAHAQRYDAARPLPPFALTLVARRTP